MYRHVPLGEDLLSQAVTKSPSPISAPRWRSSVEMLEERRLIEVSTDDEGRVAYWLIEEGVRVGNMLAMVEGEDAESVALFPG